MVTGEGDEGIANAQRELNRPLLPLPLDASGVSRVALDDELKLFPLFMAKPAFPVFLTVTAWAEEAGVGLLMVASRFGAEGGLLDAGTFLMTCNSVSTSMSSEPLTGLVWEAVFGVTEVAHREPTSPRPVTSLAVLLTGGTPEWESICIGSELSIGLGAGDRVIGEDAFSETEAGRRLGRPKSCSGVASL